MKRWWNIVFQVAATAGQLAQLYSPFIPPGYAGPVQLGVSILQGTVGVIAHNFNPDGTSAKTPFVPVNKK